MGATYFTQTPPAPGGTRTVHWAPVFLQRHLGERAEAGLVYVYLHTQGRTRNSFGGFARYQLRPERRGAPAVAVAADFITGGLQTASAYLVAGKEFHAGRTPIRAHAGYLVTQRSDLHIGASGYRGPPPNSAAAGAPYAGLEISLTPAIRLVGEIEAKTKLYLRPPVAYGLMWNPSRGTGLGIGWVNTGRSTAARFFVGVGFKIRIHQ